MILVPSVPDLDETALARRLINALKSRWRKQLPAI